MSSFGKVDRDQFNHQADNVADALEVIKDYCSEDQSAAFPVSQHMTIDGDVWVVWQLEEDRAWVVNDKGAYTWVHPHERGGMWFIVVNGTRVTLKGDAKRELRSAGVL